jgi:PadR family transcriptional regulator PadR
MTRRERLELLKGTLDLLILRTLLLGPAHGHQIARHIQRSSDDVLQVEHGSLYPALHRLEGKGWLTAKWDTGAGTREFKFYRLTAAGRRQLAVEESRWQQLVGAIGRVTARTEG